MKTAKQLYRAARYMNHQLTEDDEAVIAKDPKYAYLYARGILRKPWQNGEEAIHSHNKYSQSYRTHFKLNDNTPTIPTVPMEQFKNAYQDLLNENPKDKPDNIMTSQKELIGYLFKAIDSKYDIDARDISFQEMINFREKFPELQQFSIRFIQSLNAAPELKNRCIHYINKAESIADLFGYMANSSRIGFN